MQTQTTPTSEFIAGVLAELPILLGVLPFGVIYGVLALGAGLTQGQAQAISSVVFAGSAQIVMTQLFGVNAPVIVIVMTVFVVNLRHALYSATLAPYLQHLRPAWKWLLAYLLTDEAFAVTVLHYQANGRFDLSVPAGAGGAAQLEALPSPVVTSAAGPVDPPDPSEQTMGLPADYRHFFFLAAGLTLWSGWQISCAVGIFLGAIVPASWSLDFALALTFIALVVPALDDRAGLAAAFTAGVAAVLAYHAPYKLGLLLAALVGILVGLWVEGKQ